MPWAIFSTSSCDQTRTHFPHMRTRSLQPPVFSLGWKGWIWGLPALGVASILSWVRGRGEGSRERAWCRGPVGKGGEEQCGWGTQNGDVSFGERGRGGKASTAAPIRPAPPTPPDTTTTPTPNPLALKRTYLVGRVGGRAGMGGWVGGRGRARERCWCCCGWG